MQLADMTVLVRGKLSREARTTGILSNVYKNIMIVVIIIFNIYQLAH